MNLLRPVYHVLGFTALTLLLPLVSARGQDPVIKPPREVPPMTRLPAPSPVSARQLPDGRIEVRWTAIEGAVKYQLTRSVPPTPAQIVQPDPTGTSFIDTDVRAGSTYYYLVAAYGSDGILGMKAAAPPVTVTVAPGGTASTSTTFTATLTAPNRIRVAWTFSSPTIGAGAGAVLDRVVNASSGTTSTTVARVPASGGSFEDSFDLPGATQISYRLLIEGGPSLTSNVVPLSGGTSGDPTPVVGTTAPATAPGATFTAAAPMNLRTGATASLGSMGGTGARWLSMNEAVASVDPAGVVTARTAGTAQIVALGTSADGSLRVTSVAVVVNP